MVTAFLTAFACLSVCTSSPTTSAGSSLEGLGALAFAGRPSAAHSFVAAPPPDEGRGARRASAGTPAGAAAAPRALSFNGVDAHGGHVAFESRSVVRPEVVSLDDLDFVLAAACDADGGGIALAVAGPGGEAVALSWPPGTLLVGGSQWGCAPAPGEAPAPLYLRVAAAPRVASPRGGALFHGSLDVAFVHCATERAHVAAAFDHLSFSLARTAAAEPTPQQRGQDDAGAAGPRRTAGLSPLYAPLTWGYAQPGAAEAAATWNVVNDTSLAPGGPVSANGAVSWPAPSGGHLLVCTGCFAYAAVDVRASALFEWNVAREVEVVATVRTSAKVQFDALVNGTLQDVDSSGMVADTGSWRVPLLGLATPDATSGGARTADGVRLFSLHFSVQGVPLAVPVHLSMHVDVQTSYNNSFARAPTTPAPVAIATGGGMALSGAASIGARYTPAAGWQPVRGVYAWNVNPSAIAWDVPTPDVNPAGARGVSMRSALTFDVSLSMLGGWEFRSSTSAYTTATARPGCSTNGSYVTNTTYTPVGLTTAVGLFAELRKGTVATMTVGDPFPNATGGVGVDVVSGPACSAAGCSNVLHSGLLFPAPPGVPPPPSASITSTPSQSSTISLTPSQTPSPSSTLAGSPSETPSPTSSQTASETQSPTATESPTSTSSPTASPSLSPTPSVSPPPPPYRISFFAGSVACGGTPVDLPGYPDCSNNGAVSSSLLESPVNGAFALLRERLSHLRYSPSPLRPSSTEFTYTTYSAPNCPGGASTTETFARGALGNCLASASKFV